MQTRQFDREDIAKNKVLASVGYLVFFVPLIACPKSKLGRFCANQGLLIWIVFIAVRLAFWLLGLLPLIGGLFATVGTIANFAIALLTVLMLVRLVNRGEATELPYIGKVRLIH